MTVPGVGVIVCASEAKASDHVVFLGAVMSSHRFDGDVDSVIYQGRKIKIKWGHDACHGAPWEENDCYGIVKGWQRSDKAPGEVILCSDRGDKLIYDYAGSVANWKKQGMCGQEADKYASQSVKRLKEYLLDNWSYAMARVTIEGLEYEQTMGGIESDNAADYIADLVCEAKSAIDEHQRNLVVFMRLLAMGVA